MFAIRLFIMVQRWVGLDRIVLHIKPLQLHNSHKKI